MADTHRLPKPFISEWDWQLEGSCQGLNSSVFFHPDGERGSARARRADRAKAICQSCPVLEPCRRHALAAREPYGIWGGLTEEERRDWSTRIQRAQRGKTGIDNPVEPAECVSGTGVG